MVEFSKTLSVIHGNQAMQATIALDSGDLKEQADANAVLEGLQSRGVDFSNLFSGVAMDSGVLTDTFTTQNIGIPVQMLQTWLPGHVYGLTAARKIDEITGINTVGRWEDEEIIQPILERTGTALPYTDGANPNFTSWNANYERRTVIRFDTGLSVGALESMRSALANIDSASQKRGACIVALEIVRNKIGFFGYNAGNNRTYGVLNDPSLPAYKNVVSGTGGTTWVGKTFDEIANDVRTAMADLQGQGQGLIDPTQDAITLVVPNNRVQFLYKQNAIASKTVYALLKETYRNLRIVSAPEFEAANGAANVFYLYADRVNDGSTDDGATFKQLVPSKLRTIGTKIDLGAYIEQHANATAGVMVARPFAVTRYSGI